MQPKRIVTCLPPISRPRGAVSRQPIRHMVIRSIQKFTHGAADGTSCRLSVAKMDPLSPDGPLFTFKSSTNLWFFGNGLSATVISRSDLEQSEGS